MARAHKTIKLRYNKNCLGYLFVSAGEAKIGVGNKSYVSCSESGVTIGGGFPSKITLNTMSPCYGGMVKNIPWPISMIPYVPTQYPNIPFLALLPKLPQILAALPV